jgi:hypothetical protein
MPSAAQREWSRKVLLLLVSLLCAMVVFAYHFKSARGQAQQEEQGERRAAIARLAATMPCNPVAGFATWR